VVSRGSARIGRRKTLNFSPGRQTDVDKKDRCRRRLRHRKSFFIEREVERLTLRIKEEEGGISNQRGRTPLSGNTISLKNHVWSHRRTVHLRFHRGAEIDFIPVGKTPKRVGERTERPVDGYVNRKLTRQGPGKGSFYDQRRKSNLGD